MALNREKAWHASVNRQQFDVSPEWLAVCRTKLLEQVAQEPTSAAHARHRLSAWWHGLFEVRFTERSYRLAAISSLLLVGFGAGRIWQSNSSHGMTSILDTAGIFQPVGSQNATQVAQIRPEDDNRVRIILQQVQVREITGSRDDNAVRALLVGAVSGSVDPGVRMDSVEMLAGQTSLEIRNALVHTVKNDTNAAVRAKAIESLRRFPNDAVIREALEFALAHDSDAGVRAEAMDVLMPPDGDIQVTPELRETLSNILHASHADDFVRLRCAQILNERPLPNDTY
jgi:hypothetical protein